MGVLFASADREPATYNADFGLPGFARGVLLHLNYSAEGGATATLDIKLQYYDPASDSFEDLKDYEGNVVAFAQATGVSEDDLILYPGYAVPADASHPTATNRRFNLPAPRKLRAVAVVGTDNLTFSLGALFLN